jgi:hypothetical protein
MPSGCARILMSSTSIMIFKPGSAAAMKEPFVAGKFSFNGKSVMRRLLFAVIVWTVTSLQATGQNKVSQALLGVSEDERNQNLHAPASG